METNTITQKDFNRDIIQNNVNDIFSKNRYIKLKPASPYEDIKLKISKIIESLISCDKTTLDEELNEKFLNLDFGGEYNVDADKIGIADAAFFINLLSENNVINYSVQDDLLNINVNDKKINVTNSLLNMLKTSFDTKKPIRLDFDNDITVILKLDKDGKIQTHFIPGTLEAQNYLKDNLNCLKQAFDDENINYSYLGYSKSKQENRKKDKRSNR